MIEDAEVITEPERPAIPDAVVEPTAITVRSRTYSGSEFMVNADAFAHAQRVAITLASDTLLPKHLVGRTAKETIATCMHLVADAQRWNTDAWALMAECYPKPGGGGVAYQAKVFSGLAVRLLGVRLNYRFSGSGEDRACAAYGTFPGESVERTTPPVIFKQAVTRDRDGQLKAAWRNDPDLKLSYNAVMRWMRMHAPELVTGALTADEADLLAEERRATLPATPAPDATPQTLRDFVQTVPESRQEATEGVTVAPPSTAPPSTPEPPGATALASRRAIAELQKLATDNKLTPEDLEKLCRSASKGQRGLVQLQQGDCLEVVQEIMRTGKDRKRGA